jgi:AcrR family transcriptional regulator
VPRPRFYNLDATKRATILDAAAAEFAEWGYDGASLNRIIEAAGLSKGAFYYYFDDKADLAVTVLTKEMQRSLELLQAMRMEDGDTDFWGTFERWTREALDDYRRHPERSDLALKLGVALNERPELMATAGPLIAEAREITGRFCRRGQQLGAVRSDLSVELLMTLLQTIKNGVVAALTAGTDRLGSELLDQIGWLQLDLFRRVLEPAFDPRHHERMPAAVRNRRQRAAGAKLNDPPPKEVPDAKPE